ncbi:MAG: tRNA 2-selenouridine(34) synthase MnmH, partial [Thiobacillus sp.]
QLGFLTTLRGSETIAAWQALATRQAWSELVTVLLEQHYDPAYLKSLSRNYTPSAADLAFHTEDLSASGMLLLARAILAAM